MLQKVESSVIETTVRDVNISDEQIKELQNKSSFLNAALNGNNTGDIGELQNLSSKQREEILENELGSETDLSLIAGANRVYRMMSSTGKLVIGTIEYVGKELHIPPFLMIAASTAFIIFITFLIVNMALRILRG